MARPVIESIVEGHGEERSLRPLIHKILAARESNFYPEVRKPFRISRDKLVSTRLRQLERYAEMAMIRGGPMTRLFILLDADDDCPAELGTELTKRIQPIAANFPQCRVSINIANREYEAWFIASLETVAAHAGISVPNQFPQNVESIRGAKEWLSEHMASGQSYSPTADQARLTVAMDVNLARQRSQSFDRFCREVELLLMA
jgi:hypothetical protein